MPDTQEYPFDAEHDIKRLHGQHEVIKAAMGGRLILAPVDLDNPDIKILDSGTSDGYWLRDFHKDHSASRSLVGVDIDPSRFPKDSSDGITLRTQDILDPWPQDWIASFDIVHQRFVFIGSKGNPRPVMDRILELVKPGGWVQLIEADQEIGEDDGPAMQQFMAVMTAMVDCMGVPLKYAREMAIWLHEAGFEKVEEAIIPFDIGEARADAALKDTSIISFLAAVDGLAQYAKMLPDIPGCSKEDLDTLVSRCDREMREKGGHYPIRCVWAQKPYE